MSHPIQDSPLPSMRGAIRFPASAIAISVLGILALRAWAELRRAEHPDAASKVIAADQSASAAGAATTVSGVIVNGVALSEAQVQALARQTGTRAPIGRYWYDTISGLFGIEGQGAAGMLPAGLMIGGPLAAEASGGGNGRLTGVFINGRELHPTDVAALSQLLGQVIPGRYWFDAQGSFGVEGGGALGNIHALSASGRGADAPRGSQASGCYGSHCQNTRSWLGNNYFSDGKTGCIVMDGEVSC